MMEHLPEELPDTEAPAPSAMSVIVDGIGAFLGHVPAALKRNVFKAFNHMLKVPNAYLDGLADEIRATSDARVQLTKATGKALAKAVEIDSALALTATHTHASKILRQQTNAVKVLQQAAEELKSSPPDAQNDPIEEISEDWLNAFESDAVNMSSEQMQKLFGKMLAGEIRRPTSYSIRTVKLMAELDNDVAEIFRDFCSMACSLAVGDRAVDASVLTLGSSSERDQQLLSFGITFSRVRTLVEYGLVFQATPTKMPYDMCVLRDSNNPKVPLTYNNNNYVLVATPFSDRDKFSDLAEWGIGLSRAGRELLTIVELVENIDYTEALITYFRNKGLILYPIPEIEDLENAVLPK